MLYPHQQKVIDDNPARHLLAHGTGTGKTLTALSLADKNCDTCIIICPKALVPKWKRDISNFNSNPRVAYEECDFIVMSKEEFKRDAKTLPAYDGVIVDEAHYFAGTKSQLSKSLLWYMKKHDIKYRWLLTATPYLSTPNNIYMLARHLGHEWNYWTFQNEFFDQIQMGHRLVPKVKKGVETKLAALVQSIGSTIDMETAVEQHPALGKVPEQIFETDFFELTKSQEKGIKELNDDLFITRWTHTHQIENGFLYGDGYTEVKRFHCDKYWRIRDIVEKNDKVVIFCRYTLQIKEIKEFIESSSLRELRDRSIFVIDGSSTGIERDAIVQEAERTKHAVIIIQSQCSAGYELPSFDTIVFMSLSFSYVDYEQAIGRTHRINKLKKNRYIHLVSNGVDRDVYESIMKKQDFTLAIYENRT